MMRWRACRNSPVGPRSTHPSSPPSGRTGERSAAVFAASPILLLHTVGARTGQDRVNPLTYLPDGDRFVVFASDRGAPRHPDWFHNVVASPSVQVEVGDETLPAV